MVKPISLIYTTVPSAEVAATLAEQAVRQKLAACVNQLPKVHAVYEWEGTIEHSEEVGLLFKTTLSQQQACEQWLAEQHPYTTPAIIRLSAQANDAFADYVANETQ